MSLVGPENQIDAIVTPVLVKQKLASFYSDCTALLGRGLDFWDELENRTRSKSCDHSVVRKL